MIRLTYMNDAVSDAAFIGFQLIVTRGLCKKTCLDWHVTEHVLANSCHSHATSQVWSKRTQYMHRLDSVVAGLHWSLLLEPSPT